MPVYDGGVVREKSVRMEQVRQSWRRADVLVVGAGAAGLATAIFAARAGAGRVICLDGASRIGAKILVSGGGRCNVTNQHVGAADFNTGGSRAVRDVLRAFPASRAASFFTEAGVALHEEEGGKLFPDSNSARDIVNALLRSAAGADVEVMTRQRVRDVSSTSAGFEVHAADGARYLARDLVLATGGRSLPKSGSDGSGYALATCLGHTCTDTTPALVPLVSDDALCARLAGVAHPCELRVRVAGRIQTTVRGSLLWTHFGLSGPAALDISRHWLRARRDSAHVGLELTVCSDASFDDIDAWLLERQRTRPKALVTTVVAERLPQAVAEAWVARVGIDPLLTMAHVEREHRRRLVHALVGIDVLVKDSRGYNYAEVTSGGVPLSEVDPATMESRVCRGLYLVGEMLDVDGRLGGFNFQWAWSSAWVAGQALGRRAAAAPRTEG